MPGCSSRGNKGALRSKRSIETASETTKPTRSFSATACPVRRSIGSIDDAHASPAERFSKPVAAEFATCQRHAARDQGRQRRLVLEERLQLRNQVRMAVHPGRVVEVSGQRPGPLAA